MITHKHITMYLEAYLDDKVPCIQLGQRQSDPPDTDDDDNPRYHQEHPWFISLARWDKTDPRTWPEELRGFWWHIQGPEDAQRIAGMIAASYPNDKQLRFLVNWLTFWAGLGARFKLTF